jgi:hypothetical protein
MCDGKMRARMSPVNALVGDESSSVPPFNGVTPLLLLDAQSSQNDLRNTNRHNSTKLKDGRSKFAPRMRPEIGAHNRKQCETHIGGMPHELLRLTTHNAICSLHSSTLDPRPLPTPLPHSSSHSYTRSSNPNRRCR